MNVIQWAIDGLGLGDLPILSLFSGKKKAKTAVFKNLATTSGLQQHSLEFTRRVVKVLDGIYVAIGYGLANSILLIGDDGVIIVDTMESAESAAAVRQAFSEITDKPIRALIYTHNHADHVFGASAFADDPDLPVYAHETTSGRIDEVVSVLRPILAKRGMRMFGCFLSEEALVNAGIGPVLNLNMESTIGVVRPNRTFSDTLTDEIAGIRFTLVHAPGETDDQLFVWLPDQKVLLAGDNIYKTFPNLYTIRGTPHRNVKKWAASIDKMRALRPEYLVPSHTGPVTGADEIYRILTDYRDAICFVHDQTVRGMNMGLTPDEIIQTVTLPSHLAKSPYLQEYYGTVEWSVRAVFDGYMGWFSGNPTHLFPLSPVEKARRMADLAGGRAALLAKAKQAEADGDFQWALELADELLRLSPEDETAHDIRTHAFTVLGEKQGNPNARHYYLTCAAELDQDLAIEQLGRPVAEMVHTMPMSRFFDALSVNLDPDKSAHVETTVGFIFPDSEEHYTVCVRRGVTEIKPELADPRDITVTVASTVWKEMLAKLRKPLPTIATQFKVQGGRIAFLKFMAMFDPEYEEKE